MRILLCIIAICVLSFMGSRWSFSHFHLPRFAVQLYLTGSEFIIVGILLGPMFLNVLSDSVLSALHPLRALCLGWIGFLFGIQVDASLFKKFPREYLRTALYIPLAVTAVVFFPLMYLLETTLSLSGNLLLISTLVLSFAAANTAPSSLAIFQKTNDLHRSPLLTLFRFIAGIDALPGILATGIAGAIVSIPLTQGSILPSSLTWLFIISITGLLMGGIIVLLMDSDPTNQELTVFLTGIIVLLGGLGFYFHQSCLYMAALTGIVVGNSRYGQRLHEIAAVPERTIYILLLILAASSIDPQTAFHPGLIIAYVMFRLAGKFIAGSTAVSFWGRWPLTHRSVGLGLISEGGLSIAMAMTLQQIIPGTLSDAIIALILATVFIHELVTPYTLQYVFAKAGKL